MNKATRANKDLKQTSIQEHLLEPKRRKQTEKNLNKMSKDQVQSLEDGQMESDGEENAMIDQLLKNGQFTHTKFDADETDEHSGTNKVVKEKAEWKPVMNLIGEGATRLRMNTDLPTFSGSNGQDAEEWLMKVKFIMDKEKVPREQQLHVAVCQLEGPAFKLFYRNQGEIQEWDALERTLLRQFPPAESSNDGRWGTSTNIDGANKRIDSKRSLVFAGDEGEDAEQWVDQMLGQMEQLNLTPVEQRDWISKRLTGKALMWYRINRLNIPNLEAFIREFLPKFTATQDRSPAAERMENHEGAMNQWWPEANAQHETASKTIEPGGSSSKVLQAARNEKAKTAPSFSGSENSSKWIRTMEQTGKSLQLNDQQIFELATIKLTGSAQEWFCQEQEDERIENWMKFKRVFLYAFPPPIEPTNVDYLHQLLSRKKGASEPVGKFVQEINRLCLKLDRRIEESEKLQYLRRGLRPQLQQHALSITSVQEFLTIMQRHEQVEREMPSKHQANTPYERLEGTDPSAKSGGRYRSTGNNPSFAAMEPRTQPFVPQTMSTRPTHQTGEQAGQENTGYQARPREGRAEEPVCYGCNRPGHYRRQCPEYQWNQPEHENFHERSH